MSPPQPLSRPKQPNRIRPLHADPAMGEADLLAGALGRPPKEPPLLEFSSGSNWRRGRDEEDLWAAALGSGPSDAGAKRRGYQ
jgi:hypothetical protein